jgi:hypothetical protein
MGGVLAPLPHARLWRRAELRTWILLFFAVFDAEGHSSSTAKVIPIQPLRDP